MPDPENPQRGRMSGEDSRAVAPVVAILARLRRRARLLLVAAAAASLLAILIAAALSIGLLDYLLRMPAWMRFSILAAGLIALAIAVIRTIAPAWRFNPALTEVALRVERSRQGQQAGLRGILASGLELAQDPPASDLERGLASRVIASAVAAAKQVRPSAILNPSPARHGLAVLAICTMALAGIAVLVGPSLMTTGAMRIFAPWAGAEWPKRTGVVDATTIAVHPLGTALPLRAAVTRSDREPESTRVGARYRLITKDGPDAWRRVVLAWQGHEIGLDPASDRPAGELFERLIEPSALAIAAGAAADAFTELEYHFETDDDRTPPRRIRLVHPPAIASASVTITPPAYAAGAQQQREVFASGRRDLGAGNDQRAIVGPILAGSRIALEIELNKPVPTLPTDADRQQRENWIAKALPGLELGENVETSFQPGRWRITFPAIKSTRIAIAPRDEFGIEAQEEAAFSFDIIEDREPSATIVEPREDEAVLATARVAISGEGRDDVGVRSLHLQQQVARPPAGSPGAVAEAEGEPGQMAGQQFGESSPAPLQATLAHVLDLSALQLRPRDEVWITALVHDNFLGAGGEARAGVRSSIRRLRIISEDELVDQVRAELGALRRIAMRLDEEQAQLQRAVQSGEISEEEAQRQSSLTQRLAQQRATVDRLSQRLERNRLDDEVLEGMLQELDQLLRAAARQSERAGAQMQSATANQEGAAQLSPQQQQEVGQAQEAVRDQLGRLAEMLDRGEDSWVMSRALQRLLQQQQMLQSQTDRFGERTMGRRAEDLSPEEQEELRRLQERQEQLAESARQALDNLEERARQMQEVDPAQAAAMQQAAERGRQQQVSERMQQASENLEQNQTSTATSQQQEAIDALEQMLQDMNDAQRQRDQALRRMLEDLVQSLEKLVADQTEQIAALQPVVEAGPFDGLDSAMIAINQNTLAVADTARADQATATVAEPLDRAVRAQSDAIAALRATPVNGTLAAEHEGVSLQRLGEALAEARRLQQETEQREQERQREELRRIYREALEEQVAIRAGVAPYLDRRIDRRDRVALRALGERQETLRQRLEKIRRETEEMEEAAVFAFAHDRLDAASVTAAKKLRAGQADAAVQRHQDSAVRILASLVEALDELRRDDEFRDEEEGGGGQGGGGGAGGGQSQPLFPPLAELRLLRGLQQEAADLTRALHEARDADVQGEIQLLAELQRTLAERGKELVEKIQQAPRAPDTEMPVGPGEQQGEQP